MSSVIQSRIQIARRKKPWSWQKFIHHFHRQSEVVILLTFFHRVHDFLITSCVPFSPFILIYIPRLFNADFHFRCFCCCIGVLYSSASPVFFTVFSRPPFLSLCASTWLFIGGIRICWCHCYSLYIIWRGVIIVRVITYLFLWNYFVYLWKQK